MGGGGAGGSGGAAAAADVAGGGAVRRFVCREELPSISDLTPEAEGEEMLSAEARKKRDREARKGAIDRDKRDASIAAWVDRQRDVREGKLPSFRDAYQDAYADGSSVAPGEEVWPQRVVYPAAATRN